MRKGDTYTIGFAAAICVACSLLLAAASSLLQARQERNAALDRQRNVLKAFGVSGEQGRNIEAPRVTQLFDAHIRSIVLDGETGAVIEGLTSADVDLSSLEDKSRLPLYRWVENERVESVALPIIGKGLWGTIYGYLALESDMNTIRGITFYEHGETPGLGGEIDKNWFQDQFKGKRIMDDGALTGIQVLKGKVADKYPEGNEHAVDGISGATMTSKAVEAIIRQDLKRYASYLRNERS